MSRTRCWILSERTLCADLVERELGLFVEEGVIQALVPLREARALAARGLRADGQPSSTPLPEVAPVSGRQDATETPIPSSWSSSELRRRTLEAASSQPKVHDLGARPLVPAFVNGHTHLGMAPMRGLATRAARLGDLVKDVFFEVERHLSEEDVRAFTRLGAYECLLSGVAEVWDHYYHGNAVAQALLDVGLTGTVAPTLQDLSGPGAEAFEDQLEATHLIASNSRFRAFGIFAAVGVHATDTVSGDLLDRAGELGRRLGLPAHFHFLQSHDEFVRAQRFPRGAVEQAIRAFTDVEMVVAHALFTSQADLAALARARVTLAYCPSSQAQFGFLAPIEAWLEQGGRVAIGTDCVASNDSLDLQRELVLAASLPGVAAALSPSRAALLASGSLEAGAALETERRRAVEQSRISEAKALLEGAWGVHLPGGPRGIAPGAPANLLVLDPDHPAIFPPKSLPRLLTHASVAPAIHQLFVHGQPVAEAGNYHQSLLAKHEYRSALEEAKARAEELEARVGLG